MTNFLLNFYSKSSNVEEENSSYTIVVDKFDFHEFDLFFSFSFHEIGRICFVFNFITFYFPEYDVFLKIEKDSWDDILQNRGDLEYLTLMTTKGIKYLFDDVWPSYLPTELNNLSKGRIEDGLSTC